MAISDFTGKNIQDTYQRVVQTDGTNLADGTGSIFIPVSSSHAITASHALEAVIEITKEVSSSYAETASMASGNFIVQGNITASNISSSGTITVDKVRAGGYAGSSVFDIAAGAGGIDTDGTISCTGFSNSSTSTFGGRIILTGASAYIETPSYVSASRIITTNLTASGNISASGTGSFAMVGIGTSTPEENLHVIGNVRIASSDPNLRIEDTNGRSVEIDVTDNIFRIDDVGNNAAIFTTDLSTNPTQTTFQTKPTFLRDAVFEGEISASGDITANKFIGKIDTADTNTDASHFPMLQTAQASIPSISNGLNFNPSSDTLTIGGTTGIIMGQGHITASGNISASGDLIANNATISEGYLTIDGGGVDHGFKLQRDGLDTYRIRHLDGGLTIQNSSDSRKEMTFDGTGKVGIGNSDPQEILTVEGNISASGNVIINEITASGNISASGDLIANNISASRELSVTDNAFIGGKLSVNTTSTTARVNVVGSEVHQLNGTANTFKITGVSQANALFVSSSTKVGIGTQTPGEQLEVVGNISASGDLTVNNINGTINGGTF